MLHTCVRLGGGEGGGEGGLIVPEFEYFISFKESLRVSNSEIIKLKVVILF